MRSPVDERLALPIEQGVLLWCMRLWVANLQQEVQAGERIATMLGRLGTPEAAPFFDGFMYALSHGATRRIGVQCLCRPGVAEDERALLDAFGLAQEQRPFEALLLLRGLMTAEAARTALRSAEGLAATMAAAGRALPAPDSAVSRFALAAAPPTTAGSVTIH